MTGEKRTYYLKHTHRLEFERPVFFEPTLIRLHPRSDDQTFVRSVRLDISPHPAGMRCLTDLAGNTVWQVWFSDITLSLSVTATSVVDRYRPAPYSRSGVHPDIPDWEDPALLACYRSMASTETPRTDDVDGELPASLRDLGQRSNTSPLAARTFFEELSRLLAKQFQWDTYLQRTVDASGAEAHGAHVESLRLRAAEQMAQVARAFGFAARLVRGHTLTECDEIDYATRVWVECYVPHDGWRGYDPSGAQPVDSRYLAIATGRDAAAIQCVQGAVRGTACTPELRTQIIVREAADVECVDLSVARLPHRAARPR